MKKTKEVKKVKMVVSANKLAPPSQPVNVQIVAASLMSQAQPLTKKVSDLKVNDEATYQLAATLMAQLKELDAASVVEEKRITDPLNTALKAARSHFKPFHNLVEAVQTDTKTKMLKFVNQREAAAAKLLADFGAGKIKKMSTVVSNTAALQIASGDAVVRKIKVARVVDKKKVPLEFMEPNMAAIREAFRAGREVPGCEWVEENNIAI